MPIESSRAPVPRRLILLRHGQTDWNADGRMQGQIDTDLTEAGRTQAKEAARELARRDPIAIVSSDLRRAWDTATILAEHCGAMRRPEESARATPLGLAGNAIRSGADRPPLRSDVRLRETSLGEWEGLTHVEVDARDPGVRLRWRFDARLAPPGGEEKFAVARRGLGVVTELSAEYPDWADRPIVLVAHGGLIAALTAVLLDLPVEHWPALGSLGNASWVELSGWRTADPATEQVRWRLDVWNASAKVIP